LGQLHWKKINIKNKITAEKNYVVAAAAEFYNKFIQFFLPLVFH
jgi:hypothetical protein